MPDVVVTVPKNFEFNGKRGLAAWIAEGDLPGDPWGGEDWHFYLGGNAPNINPGERVYVVCEGKLRGYSELIRIEREGNYIGLVRHNRSEAVTLADPIKGFQGFRYRWWNREDEIPFPDWQTP